MEDNKSKILWGIFGVLLLVVVGSGIYYLKLAKTNSKKSSHILNREKISEPVSPTVALPTLSPEEKEIIANLQTHEVKIENGQLNPETLTIKLHDQVMWVNNDNKPHKITGENWGGVPIQPGESFTKKFDQEGTFSYSCALQPELKGTIIVK